MLAVQAKTKTRKAFYAHSTGDENTTIRLEHRKTGEMAELLIISRIPLSLGEIRDAITEALGDHWQWRRLFQVSEYSPF